MDLTDINNFAYYFNINSSRQLAQPESTLVIIWNWLSMYLNKMKKSLQLGSSFIESFIVY